MIELAIGLIAGAGVGLIGGAGVALFLEGQPAQALDSAPDILPALIEGLHDGALVLDGDTIIAANAVAAVFFATPLPEFVGQHVRHVLPGYAGSLPAPEARTTLDGEEIGIFSRMVANRGLSKIELEMHAQPLPDSRTLVLLREVEPAADPETTAGLRSELDALRAAGRQKNRFLASMSHELRTPMNAVLGYAEMLNDDLEDAGHATYLPDVGRILKAGKHLLQVINTVLDIAKIEAGHMEVHLGAVDPSAIVEELVATVQPLAQSNNNTLVVRDEGVDTFAADPSKVRQILLNLLGNACKFTDGGEVTVGIRRVVRSGVDCCAFEVSDTGIGIKADEQGRVFQEFTQASSNTTNRYGGTGLGLAISRRLAHLMGGNVTLQSTPGEGSTFTLILPIITPETALANEPA